MSRRGDKVSALDALKGLGELSELAPEVEEPVRKGGVVALPIKNISPDPIQARRLLPAGLRNRFLVGELSSVEVLDAWRDLAAEDENEAEMLDSQVVRLAHSLQAQEQINPITVSRLRKGFILISR